SLEIDGEGCGPSADAEQPPDQEEEVGEPKERAKDERVGQSGAVWDGLLVGPPEEAQRSPAPVDGGVEVEIRREHQPREQGRTDERPPGGPLRRGRGEEPPDGRGDRRPDDGDAVVDLPARHVRNDPSDAALTTRCTRAGSASDPGSAASSAPSPQSA